VLQKFQKILNIGKISHIKRGRSHLKEQDADSFQIQNIKDLTEVIVPLFEKYPLWSKKGKEFEIWKDVVRYKYIVSLGGYSGGFDLGSNFKEFFIKSMNKIRTIRNPYDSVNDLTIDSDTLDLVAATDNNLVNN